MNFKIVIIFMDQAIQRLSYENYDIHEGIKHSLEVAHDKKLGNIVETIMIEFVDKGMEV